MVLLFLFLFVNSRTNHFTPLTCVGVWVEVGV